MQSPLIPREWERFEREEASRVARELMGTYGSLGVTIYIEVKKQKLFVIASASFFLEEFIDFYRNNSRDFSESAIARRKLYLLVSLFPSCECLAKLLTDRHNTSNKEMLLFKLILDIMTWYYKATEYPLYKKLQKEVIPLALRFYKQQPKKVLNEIKLGLLSNGCTGCNVIVKRIGNQVLLMNSRKDYLEHYRMELKKLANLTGGTDEDDYYS